MLSYTSNILGMELQGQVREGFPVKVTPVFSFPAQTSLLKSCLVYPSAHSASPLGYLTSRSNCPKLDSKSLRSHNPCPPSWKGLQVAYANTFRSSSTPVFFSRISNSPGNPSGPVIEIPIWPRVPISVTSSLWFIAVLTNCSPYLLLFYSLYPTAIGVIQLKPGSRRRSALNPPTAFSLHVT